MLLLVCYLHCGKVPSVVCGNTHASGPTHLCKLDRQIDVPSPPSSMIFAVPKSVILMCMLSSSRMFSGFRSLCVRGRVCEGEKERERGGGGGGGGGRERGGVGGGREGVGERECVFEGEGERE